ncbi:MAG: hypothetical protein KIT80_14280 [Chitinophagaceae bacterium]|nr:hypothetical protein [Chitinophagaceae bacterium]MCW5928080.1 hypothetical protein [Chitinophagaceae bacterium]
MNEPNEFQQQLFSYLKQQLPPHLSLVDEISELLDISVDSVYRRIRGEKSLTLTELKLLSGHFHFSVDQMLNLQNDSVLFQAPGLNGTVPLFSDYMKGMLEQFKYFNSFKTKQIFYLCKDIPFWYFFLYPEIAAFKVFFWSRTINNSPEYAGQQFSLEEHPFTDCYKTGVQILELHNQMHSIELWNLESIHSTINQIAYYKDAGIFRSKADFERVLESFSLLLSHLKVQTERGTKFLPGRDAGGGGNIEFYVNELILGNNTILLKLDDTDQAMITYNVLSYLICRDDRFVKKAYATFNNLLNSAALISKTGEKERNKFFNKLKEKVDGLAAGNS